MLLPYKVLISSITLDTKHKLIQQNMFRRRPGLALNVYLTLKITDEKVQKIRDSKLTKKYVLGPELVSMLI